MNNMSRPVRARGLKHGGGGKGGIGGKSRPVRARGLKLNRIVIHITADTSRPVRARGLKHAVPSGVSATFS